MSVELCSLTADQKDDLVFVRREPNMTYYEKIDGEEGAEKKKKAQSKKRFVSRRLQYYADPKLYRIKRETDFGSFILMDPDTKVELQSNPFPPERFEATYPISVPSS